MFEQKPLTHYSLPRYGRTTPDSFKAWASWLLRRGAGKLAALLLVAGLGLLGCGDDGKTEEPPIDGDGIAQWTENEHEAESEDLCANGEYLGCVEEGAPAMLFCADGKPIEISCNDVCRDKGYHEGYCHSELLPNPCDCRYAAIDGDIGE